MLFMVEIFVFAGVGAGVVIRSEVDVCGDQMCDQMRPVCGVVDGELGCTDYDTESAMLVDIDVMGHVTVNPIQVSLMVIGGGRLAYWRNLRLRMTFHKDEREAGNLYRITEDDYGEIYVRYYGTAHLHTTRPPASTGQFTHSHRNYTHFHTHTQTQPTRTRQTATRTQTATHIQTQTVTHTKTQTVTHPQTAQTRQTATGTHTATHIQTQTVTHTQTQTVTHPQTLTHTATHARTRQTLTGTHTATHAQTHTATHAQTHTATHSQTHTATHAQTHTATHAQTLTRTQTGTHTSTHAQTGTHRHTATQPQTGTHTQTGTETHTHSFTPTKTLTVTGRQNVTSIPIITASISLPHHVFKIWHGVIIGLCLLIAVLIVVFCIYKYRNRKVDFRTYYDNLEMGEVNRGAESPL